MNQPNPQQDVFTQFIEKLKEEKSEEQITKLLAALYQFQAEALYEIMLEVLTDQDFQAIEKIEDDDEAEQEINRLFKERTQLTPQEFVVKLRDTLSQTYLDNQPPKKPAA